MDGVYDRYMTWAHMVSANSPDAGTACERHGDVVSSFHRDVVWVWQVYPIVAWDWRGERAESDESEVTVFGPQSVW